MEDAYKEMEMDYKTPSIVEAYNEFARAIVEYRDAVLYDLVAASIAASGDNSSKIGRSTEWGSKKQWKKPVPSVGNSSKMSVLSEEAEGVDQAFEDYGGEPVSVVKEPVLGESAPEEPIKPKKKKIVRRVVKRVKKPEAQADAPTTDSTAPGSKLTPENISALRHVEYYISDINTDPAGVLLNDIRISIEDACVKTSDVGTIMDTISYDVRNKGMDAAASLGLEEGVVSEECLLPKVLEKLAGR